VWCCVLHFSSVSCRLSKFVTQVAAREDMVMARLLQSVGITLALCLATSSSTFADTVFFSDRTAWELAVGRGVTTQTFDSYPWNSPTGDNLGLSATLEDIRYEVEGEMFGNDTAAILYDAEYLVGQYLEWQNHDPNTLRVMLPVRATAIGFDYGQFYGIVAPFSVSLGNGDGAALRSQAYGYAFFGAISTEPLTRFSVTSPAAPLIDNLSYGGTSPVPEPGTLLLFATGAAAMGRRAWKRKAGSADTRFD
jgi:PEP-CTERM motif-containing protein